MATNLRTFPKAAAEPAIEVYSTIPSVAQRLHAGESTVKRWLSSGRLKPTKAGTKTLIAESDLQAFLKACSLR